jgi:hypothetical protein
VTVDWLSLGFEAMPGDARQTHPLAKGRARLGARLPDGGPRARADPRPSELAARLHPLLMAVS